MDGDMTGWRKRVIFDFFADIGEKVVGTMSRKTGLITLSWLGVLSSMVGIWLMLGLGFALFTFGGFITVIAIIALNEDNKKKKVGTP